MPIKPRVYCSVPHRPRFYRCAFKNKSSLHRSRPQKGLNVERADLSGDGEPPRQEQTGQLPPRDFCASSQSLMHEKLQLCFSSMFGVKRRGLYCIASPTKRERPAGPQRAASLGSTPSLREDGWFGQLP